MIPAVDAVPDCTLVGVPNGSGNPAETDESRTPLLSFHALDGATFVNRAACIEFRTSVTTFTVAGVADPWSTPASQ